jgi:glycosyltransferase involved in cell wall biosynthesis
MVFSGKGTVGDADFPLDISVVVPVYRSRKWILTCLESLANQSLRHDRYEIILVFNGPDDGGRETVEAFVALHGSLNIQLLSSVAPSAAHARNIGTAAARGKYLTWVDADDWISAEYLELMILSARPGIIPLTQIVNVFEDGTQDTANLINSSILDLRGPLISPADFARGLSFLTCKLLPTWMAKAVPFEEGLRSGEDVALYARMFASYSFKFNIIPALAGAIYFRLMRDSSVSRQADSYDFLVTQRLDVIESLNGTLQLSRNGAAPLVRSFINSQASFVRRFYDSNPSESRTIEDELARRQFGYFPWTRMYSEVDRLVVAYNFLPYSDTGAMVTGKRIREEGRPVDVVTHKMDGIRAQDSSHLSIAQPYVQFVSSVDGPATFASYIGIVAFCMQGTAAIETWKSKAGRQYKDIYSRAMWPASHFLAALYKTRHPEVRWTAEFSDPIQLDNTGLYRKAPFKLDRMAQEILDSLNEGDREMLASNLDVYFWAENLAYVLADELVFTNSNQLHVMDRYAEDRMRRVIRSKAHIEEQPTLSADFYRVQDCKLSLESNRVNIAYFGEFYSTRGLNEVLEAFRLLPAGAHSKVRLHIFTSNVNAAKKAIDGLVGPANGVRVSPSLPYFEFLNALTKFDCLIVNDAVSSGLHEVNPYLPSKLSDYRGAGTPIWAIVERGSVLSGLALDYMTSVGDVTAAGKVLSSLAALDVVSGE